MGSNCMANYAKSIERAGRSAGLICDRSTRKPRAKEIRYNDLYSLYNQTQKHKSKPFKEEVKHRKRSGTIEREEKVNTNRSRSEGSNRREAKEDKLCNTSTSLISHKIAIRDNYEARRKDFAKDNNYDSNSQLIYTFRENGDSVENDNDTFERDVSFRSNINCRNTIEYPSKENTVKMAKKDLYVDEDRYNTITRNNEAFSQTLLSLKHGKKEFSNTGKYIENMTSSDLNIMKSSDKHDDNSYTSNLDTKPKSSKYRSISNRRTSRTDRRDVTKHKSKRLATIEPRVNRVDAPQAQDEAHAFEELQKKYNKLKRHYRKEKRYYQGKVQSLYDQNKALTVKLKKLEEKVEKCE